MRQRCYGDDAAEEWLTTVNKRGRPCHKVEWRDFPPLWTSIKPALITLKQL